MLDAIISFASKPWVGTALGICGLFAAAYFYWLSKQRGVLAYQRQDITIIGGSNAGFPQGVEIRFQGEPVDRVTRSRVVLWNAGNVTLQGDAIVALDPLRFELPADARFLRAEVVSVCRAVNDIKLLHKEQNIIELTFDYLDKNDGASLDIIHSADKSGLQLLGTMKGMPTGLSEIGDGLRELKEMGSQRFLTFLPLFGLVVLIFSLGEKSMRPLIPDDYNVPFIPDEANWLFILFALTYIVGPPVVLWANRRRFPPALVPVPNDNRGTAKESVG